MKPLKYWIISSFYSRKHGKPLKPVKRHKNSKAKVPNTITCPHCGAPHIYLYDNNGGKGQFKCKVCGNCFNYKNYYSKAIIRKCPYCSKTLEKIKERKDYDIYKCKNDGCPYYKINLALMTKEEKELFKKEPFRLKSAISIEN